MREYQQYIGGEWSSADGLFDDLNPFTGKVMAQIAAGTRADAARAVDAAAAAFPAWAALPPAEKQTLFLRAADIVERRAGEIKALLAEETGCAGGFAGFQILTATRLLRQAAEIEGIQGVELVGSWDITDGTVEEVRLVGTFNDDMSEDDRANLLAEASRVLRPGGTLCVHGLVASRSP